MQNLSLQGTPVLYRLFLVSTALFLFRGIFPVDAGWLSPAFCVAAAAFLFLSVWKENRSLALQDPFVRTTGCIAAYFVLLALNPGHNDYAWQKIFYIFSASLPAYFLGFFIASRPGWEKPFFGVVFVFLVAALLFNLPENLFDGSMGYGWPELSYALVGALGALGVIGALLLRWPLALALFSSAILIMTGHLTSFTATAILVGLYAFVSFRRAVIVLVFMVAAGTLFGLATQGGTFARMIYKAESEYGYMVGQEDPAFPRRGFGRAKMFVAGVNGFIRAPVAGHGTGSFMSTYKTYPHNLVIEQLFEHGLIGFGVLLALFWQALANIRDRLKVSEAYQIVGAMGFIAAIFAVLSGEGLSRILFFALGLSAALAARAWRSACPAESR